MITARQAALICEAHEIQQLLENDEELELLELQNPDLLDAYRQLYLTANGGNELSAQAEKPCRSAG